MRLELEVGNKYYYDIGLRKGNSLLSTEQWQFGEKVPRFLEDFIERYGKRKVHLISYGSCIDDKRYIDGVLK